MKDFRANISLHLAASKASMDKAVRDIGKGFGQKLQESLAKSMSRAQDEQIKSLQGVQKILRSKVAGFDESKSMVSTMVGNMDKIADSVQSGTDRAYNAMDDLLSKIEGKLNRVTGFLSSQAFSWISRYFSYQAIKSTLQSFAQLEEIAHTITRTLGQPEMQGKVFSELIGGATALGMSFQEYGQVLEGLAEQHVKVGKAGQDLIELSRQTGKFIKATGVSAGVATEMAGEMSTAFGMTNAQIYDTMNSLTAIQKVSGISRGQMEELIRSTSEARETVASYADDPAKAVGSLMRATASLGATFSAVGLKAGEAGKLVADLMNPDNLSKNVYMMSQLGIGVTEYYDMLEKGEPGAFVDRINEKLPSIAQNLMKMSIPARSALAKQLGLSMKQVRLLAKGGKEAERAMDQMKKEEKKKADEKALETQSKKALVTLASQFQRLENVMQTMFLKPMRWLWDRIIYPIIKKGMEFGQKISGWFDGLSETWKYIVGGGALLLTTFGGIGTIFSGIKGVIMLLLRSLTKGPVRALTETFSPKSISRLKNVFSAVGSGVMKGASGVGKNLQMVGKGAKGAAELGFKGAKGAFNVMRHPIQSARGAIQATGKGATNMLGMAKGAGTALKGGVKGIGPALKGLGKGAGGLLKAGGPIGLAISGVVGGVMGAFDEDNIRKAFGDKIQKEGPNIGMRLASGIGGAVDGLAMGLLSDKAISDITKNFYAPFEQFSQGNIGEGILSLAKLSPATAVFASGIDVARKTLNALSDSNLDAAAKGEAVGKAMMDAQIGFGISIGGIIDSLINFVGKIWDGFSDYVIQPIKKAIQYLGGQLSKFGNWIGNLFSNIGDLPSKLYNGIKDIFVNFGSFLSGIGNAIYNSLGTSSKQFIDRLDFALQSVPLLGGGDEGRAKIANRVAARIGSQITTDLARDKREAFAAFKFARAEGGKQIFSSQEKADIARKEGMDAVARMKDLESERYTIQKMLTDSDLDATSKGKLNTSLKAIEVLLKPLEKIKTMTENIEVHQASGAGSLKSIDKKTPTAPTKQYRLKSLRLAGSTFGSTVYA